MSEPDFYAGDHTAVQAALAELQDLEKQLEHSMQRWAELEELQSAYEAARRERRGQTGKNRPA